MQHYYAEFILQKVALAAVGFEPTQLALVELESTPLDHSGKLSMGIKWHVFSKTCLQRGYVTT